MSFNQEKALVGAFYVIKNLHVDLRLKLYATEDTKRRLRSVYVCHLSMLLSGFGNSVIYIGMFPYISSVG